MNWSKAVSLILISVVGSACIAQDITDVEPKAYGAYTGSALDTVDLTSGNLLLHIPLVSFPQMGSLPPLSFSAELNNAPYSQTAYSICGDFAPANPLTGALSADEPICETLSSRYDTSPPGAIYQAALNASHEDPRQPTTSPILGQATPIPGGYPSGCDTPYGTEPCQYFASVEIWGEEDPGYTLPSMGVYLASSFEGGIVLGQTNTQSPSCTDSPHCSSASSAYQLSAIDPSGTTHELEADVNNYNLYHTSDGSGYSFAPMPAPGITPSNSNANNVLFAGNADDGRVTFDCDQNVLWIGSPPSFTSGVRFGTLYSPTGIQYSDTSYSASTASCANAAASDTAPHLLYTTEQDPSGNKITRGPWYWSGYNSNAAPGNLSTPFSEINTFYANAGDPYFIDSLNRQIPDAITMQATEYKWVGGQGGPYTMTWNVPGPENNKLAYQITYTSIENVLSFAPGASSTMPDPSTSITANGWAISSITLPNSAQNTLPNNPQWTFTYCQSTSGLCQDSNNNVIASSGDLLSLSTPTGGSISYTYTSSSLSPSVYARCNAVCHAVQSRTVSDGVNPGWKTTYSYGSYSSLPAGLTADTCLQPSGTHSAYYAFWTLETDSQGNDTVHTFCPVSLTSSDSNPIANQFREVQTQYYQGSAPSLYYSNSTPPAIGTLLKTVQTSYQAQVDIPTPYAPDTQTVGSVNILPKQITTTNAAGYSVTEGRTYGTLGTVTKLAANGTAPLPQNGQIPQSIPVSYLLPTSVSTYSGAAVSGSPLRTTKTQFMFQNPPQQAYINSNFIGLPLLEQTFDGGTNLLISGKSLLEATNYYYDDKDNLGTQVNCTSPAKPSDQPCGYLTRVQRMVDSKTNVTTSTWYTAQGMPRIKQDANGNQTSYTYQCNNGYPKTVTRASSSSTNTLPETSTYGYDCYTGDVTSITDPNSVVTKYVYVDPNTNQLKDPLGRLAEVQRAYGLPEQNDIRLSYPSMTEEDIARDKDNVDDGSIVSKTYYDGLGRVVQQSTLTDTDYDYYNIYTSYNDDSSRPWQVTNPEAGSHSSSDPAITYTYDALGRVVEEVKQDNSRLYWCYDMVPNGVLPSAVANILCGAQGADISSVASQDESGNPRLLSYDALDHLVGVTEPNPIPGTTNTSTALTVGALNTNYIYDALGNLTWVNQTGGPGDQTRYSRFLYDSLSRLIYACNPEIIPSGQNCWAGYWSWLYNYDGNGNVITRMDARGRTARSSYDGLNRLLSRTYNGTPASCYEYDKTPASLQNSSIANPIGHLTAEWTQTGTCSSNGQLPELPGSGLLTSKVMLAYDGMGRATIEQQCVAATCSSPFSLAYSYDLAGDVTSAGNGMGTIAWLSQYDNARRLTSVRRSTLGTNLPPTQLFGGTSFLPAGITNWTVGDPVATGAAAALDFTKDYDVRFRVKDEIVTGHQ